MSQGLLEKIQLPWFENHHLVSPVIPLALVYFSSVAFWGHILFLCLGGKEGSWVEIVKFVQNSFEHIHLFNLFGNPAKLV